MVLIPQHKSDAQIKTPSAQLSGGGSISSSKRAQAGMIQAVEQVQDRLLQIKDFRQTTEANAFATEKLNGLKQQSQTDSDMNINVYDEEIAKIGSDASRNISGQLAKEEFMASYNRQAQATKWGIENDFRRKEIASTIALNKYNQDVLINSYPKMDEASQISAVATFKKQMERSVELGIYTREVADIELKSTQASLFQAEADYDSVANPEQFLANDREDYQIPDDEYKKAKETAVKTIEKDKKVAEKENTFLMIENEAKLTLNLADKRIEGLTGDEKADVVTTINQMMFDEKISSDYGQAYIDMITSPSSVDADVKKYTGLAGYSKAVFEATDNDKKKAATIRLMERNTQGKLTEDKINVVLKAAYEAGDNVRDNWIQNTIGWFQTQEKKEFDKSTEGLSKEEKKKMDADRMTYDFFAGMAEGVEPEKAKADAVTNEQIRTNPDRSKYSVGDSVNTPLGLMYVHGYYPDGEPDVRPEKPNK